MKHGHRAHDSSEPHSHHGEPSPGAAPHSSGSHHGHSHGLGGHATATGKHRSRLVLVLAITMGVFVLQIGGAVFSGSLALLADAGHMLSDAAGVSIALLASFIAARPATARRTYGFQRAEVLAALVNVLLLIAVAAFIFTEALSRLGSPAGVSPTPMLIAAVLGAAANAASLLILHSGQQESLNLRGAYLEVLADLLGSFAVIVAALVIALTGWQAADAWASILIALMILPRAWNLLKDVLHVLLEAAPDHMDAEQIRRHILELEDVADVHDIHAWTITSGVPVFTAHLVLPDEVFSSGRAGAVLERAAECLSSHFDTEHCTLQLEPLSQCRNKAALHA